LSAKIINSLSLSLSLSLSHLYISIPVPLIGFPEKVTKIVNQSMKTIDRK